MLQLKPCATRTGLTWAFLITEKLETNTICLHLRLAKTCWAKTGKPTCLYVAPTRSHGIRKLLWSQNRSEPNKEKTKLDIAGEKIETKNSTEIWKKEKSATKSKSGKPHVTRIRVIGNKQNGQKWKCGSPHTSVDTGRAVGSDWHGQLLTDRFWARIFLSLVF